jgi:hypothetical protein
VIGIPGFPQADFVLNGPQTTGREYPNLSQPTHGMAPNDDAAVPMRDGLCCWRMCIVRLSPAAIQYCSLFLPIRGKFKILVRPAGFIETGASDFFVPRGYLHVIANCRGTSGFGGPSVSLMGIAMTCTTSSNGPRSNPGQTAMSA